MEEDLEEVLDAAQQLMQLSNDDAGSSNVVTTENNNNNNNNKRMKKVHDRGDSGEEEVDQKRCQIAASIWLKIEEIFGKDDEDQEYGSICRPKKRRFRSMQSIYRNTKPIVNGRFSGNGGGGGGGGVLTGLWC